MWANFEVFKYKISATILGKFTSCDTQKIWNPLNITYNAACRMTLSASSFRESTDRK